MSSEQFFDPKKDDQLFKSHFFQEQSDEDCSEDDECDVMEFQIKVQDEDLGASQQFVSQDRMKASQSELRQESSGGLKRRQSSEDVFQTMFARTYNMVRTQSKVKLARLIMREISFGSDKVRKLSGFIFQTVLLILVRLLVNDSIQEIIKILDYLLKMHEQDLYERINQTIKELQTVEGQLKVVKELLVNCSKEPTKKLNELKRDILPLSKSTIRAEKSSDVNVMMLNYIRDYLIDKLLPTLLNLCQKTLYNEVAMDKIQLSSDLGVTVINPLINLENSRLKMINILFSTAVDMSQTDLLSLDKNHQDWKQVNKATTFKSLGDPEKITRSFDQFAKSIMMGHALISSKSKYQNSFIKKVFMVYSAFLYLISDKYAMQHAMNHISEMKVENAIEVMSLIEQPGVKNIMELGYPSIAYNKKIYIDPIVLPITIESMNKEIIEGTINKITPINLLMVNQELHNNDQYRQQLFIKSKSKLKIRLLCNEKLQNPQTETNFDLTDDEMSGGFIKSVLNQCSLGEPSSTNIFDTIMIHIHGGGFVAQSSGTHQCHTREWAIKLKIPIFSIDYSLAPKNPYPAALDDCWQAYHWIITTASKYFNINPKVIILAGDSAGGNLVISLTALLIKYGQRVPDGIFVAYPATDMRLCYSPSYLFALNDKIMSHTMLGICIHSYSKNPLINISKDPFMSPILFSDEVQFKIPIKIHQKFPPSRIVCGTKDPLVDNSWRFASRLLKQGVDCKMTMYEEISHGFLNFNTINGMKEVWVCLEDSILYIQEIIDARKKEVRLGHSFESQFFEKDP